MMRFMSVVCLTLLLCIECSSTFAACRFNLIQYARCQEIKNRILSFDGGRYGLHEASNIQMTNAQHNAELEELERAYRANGC